MDAFNSMHVHRWRCRFNLDHIKKMINLSIETMLKFIEMQMAYSLTKAGWKRFKLSSHLNKPISKMTPLRYKRYRKRNGKIIFYDVLVFCWAIDVHMICITLSMKNHISVWNSYDKTLKMNCYYCKKKKKK